MHLQPPAPSVTRNLTALQLVQEVELAAEHSWHVWWQPVQAAIPASKNLETQGHVPLPLTRVRWAVDEQDVQNVYVFLHAEQL